MISMKQAQRQKERRHSDTGHADFPHVVRQGGCAELFVSASALGVSLVPVQAFPVTTPAALRGTLAKAGRKLPEEDALKASIKARLKARNAA